MSNHDEQQRRSDSEEEPINAFVPPRSDPDQQQRIDDLLTDPRFQKQREAAGRSDDGKDDPIARLRALGAEAEKDPDGTERRAAEYDDRSRENREAAKSKAAAEAEAEAQRMRTRRAAPSSREPGDDSRKRASSVFEPVRRASCPRLSRLGQEEAGLPDFPGADAPEPDSQMLLPLPDVADVVQRSPSWILWLFDRTGGDDWSGGGRGAPWPLRLFVYALLHLDVDLRDGEWHTIRFKTETVIDWLHPNGWKNMSRDWHRLPDALDWMRRLAYVPVPDFGRVALLFPSVIPSAPTDPLVEFTIRIPFVAAYGDRLDWLLLKRYGCGSFATAVARWTCCCGR